MVLKGGDRPHFSVSAPVSDCWRTPEVNVRRPNLSVVQLANKNTARYQCGWSAWGPCQAGHGPASPVLGTWIKRAQMFPVLLPPLPGSLHVARVQFWLSFIKPTWEPGPVPQMQGLEGNSERAHLSYVLWRSEP